MTDAPPKAGRREWLGLAVIALPCLLYAMDLTVLNLALPSLSADLKPTGTQLLWTVDIYGFMVAGFLIPMGTLGDRVGRRRLLMAGAAAFGAASVLAAFARSPEALIAARAVLGVAGATLAPSTLSLIRNMFRDPGQRMTAISVWTASFSAGGALGPILGGVLLQHFRWGSVFLLAVPVMLLLLTAGPLLLPEFRDPRAGRPDVASAVLSLAAVLSAIYGLKRAAVDGPTWTAGFFLAAGAALAALFLRRQSRRDDAMIDLRLFRAPGFAAALAVITTSTFVVFGTFLFLSQYLQGVLGMEPFRAGMWSLPSGLGFVAGSVLTPPAARRWGPARTMAGGLLLAAAGFALLARLEGLPLFVLGSAFFAVGMSPVFTLTTDLVVGSAPPERAGAASALSETSSEFGGALGIAVLGSLGAAVFRRSVDRLLPPVAAFDAARSSLGGALEAASRLPAAEGDVFRAAARGAFSQGLHISAACCAALALALAAAVPFLLRPSRGAGSTGGL
jgi:DHA2 family multidrug resistance protein-like MFS transporter